MEMKYYRKGTDDDKYIIPELIEKDMYRFKTKLKKFFNGKKGNIVDCGAHIGVFSKLCLTFIDCEIYAFEPQLDNYSLLKQNLLNGKKDNKIHLYNSAVGIKTKKIKLYSGDGTGRFSCVPKNHTFSFVEVNSINLEKFILSLDSILILKLDLEGYEAKILNNVSKNFFKKILILIIEEHHIKINHNKIIQNGFKLWYYPSCSFFNNLLLTFNIIKPRHFVYIKKVID